MERERTFNPSACGSKPPGSANLEIIGPVTVAAERGGLLIRWLAPTAGSNPAWSSIPARDRDHAVTNDDASVPQLAEGVR